ncbi:MAG: tRNA dihydrouridine synthase DusB [Firmicutes bacterium]|nr:tRNA dihydrouridine synthase DusB [Bacillota bacterium]
MVRIGSVELKHGLMLAPMAGVTDAAFRLTAFRFGAEYAVSEMVSAKAVCYDDKKTGALLCISPGERPMGVQIFGSDPYIMAEAAKRIMLRPDAPDIIDINMGCPVRKIAGNGEGSALMRNPALAGRIVRAVSDAVSVPVTVKFRSGWDASSLNAPEFARVCEENGAAALCVHGRTREQLYADPVDLDVIKDVKNAVSVPVFGNGGIYTPEEALYMLNYTGCDGIAVGRGAMGQPWIFDAVSAALGGTDFSLPDSRTILDTALSQLDIMLRFKPEEAAVKEARRQMSYYIKGIPGAASLRASLMTASSPDEIRRIMTEGFERLE